MNQEKVGNTIKSIRLKNNLTQKEFADTLGVTYQAVSKWENGKNLPDIAVLKEISEKFNIDINELLDTKKEITKKKNKLLIPIIIVVLVLVIICTYFCITHHNNFGFKTIDTTCNEFKISGSIAYNKSKTIIYISDLDYCGEEDNTKYEKIISQLYLTNNGIDQKIYTDEKDKTTLDEYLKDFNMSVNSNICLNFEGDLVLTLKAYDKNHKITEYDIPLSLSDTCTLK